MARPKKENRSEESIARRIAFAIVRANYGTVVKVLPNWYRVQEDDDLTIVNKALERSARLFAKEVAKEMLSRTKTKKTT